MGNNQGGTYVPVNQTEVTTSPYPVSNPMYERMNVMYHYKPRVSCDLYANSITLGDKAYIDASRVLGIESKISELEEKVKEIEESHWYLEGKKHYEKSIKSLNDVPGN